MPTPIHIHDQREAACRDALKLALRKSEAKILVLFAIYPDDSSAAIAGVNVNHCSDNEDTQIGLKVGQALGGRLAAMYTYLGEQAAKTMATGETPPGGEGGPEGWLKAQLDQIDWTRLAPDHPDTQLVGEAVEAILRSLVKAGTLLIPGEIDQAQVMERARALAGLAMNEDWRKLQ